jgi:hypothetical protein
MIEPNMEHKYNIILSIFLGIVIIILIDQNINKPIVATIYKK